MGILELMKERRIYFDGGMGSLLQARGLKPGELPETWNLSRPEIITEIHREYLDAGSDVVTTNTFGANHFKFKEEDGYSVKEIVTAAVRNAKNAIAAAGHGYAALDMGPTGKLLKPYGDLEFEDAYAVSDHRRDFLPVLLLFPRVPRGQEISVLLPGAFFHRFRTQRGKIPYPADRQ